jgi:hypothetical protein
VTPHCDPELVEATNPKIGVPFAEPGVHDTVAEVLPAVTTTLRGADGVVTVVTVALGDTGLETP